MVVFLAPLILVGKISLPGQGEWGLIITAGLLRAVMTVAVWQIVG